MAGDQNTSLHDELLQALHQTGMYNYAEDIDLVQNGEFTEVKMHEDMRLWSMEDGYPSEIRGLSEEDLREGEARISAVDEASQKAIAAAEQVKAKQRALMETDLGDDTVFSTPGKHRKFKRGTGKSAAAEFGGRSNSKGLRHFSMKVCEKVEGKGRTTYNEVADELVNDLPNQHEPGSPGGMQYDEKNIRRRVYDALNVLMAMGIISRERKEIFWKGLPQGPQLSLDRLRGEKQRLCQQLNSQRQYIAELAQQQVTYKTLMRRNGSRTVEQLHESNAAGQTQLTALPLPFLLIQVDRNATVEIKISEDNRQAHFDFERMPFKFQHNEDVLQEMGLCSPTDPLAARAISAAGDAMSPRPATQTAPSRTNGTTVPNSRAHPALPPVQPTPHPLAQTSPRQQHSFAQQMASKSPGMQPNGSLGQLNLAAPGQQPNWFRPSVQQILMQQAMLQQSGLQPRQMSQAPLMLRPGPGGQMAVSVSNQQIPGAQPYRSVSANAPLQMPVSSPGSGTPRSILSLPPGAQAYSSPPEWAHLGPASNHARLLHDSQMMTGLQAPSFLMSQAWRPSMPTLQSPGVHVQGLPAPGMLQVHQQQTKAESQVAEPPELQGQMQTSASTFPASPSGPVLRPQAYQSSPRHFLEAQMHSQASGQAVSGEMQG